MNIYIRSFKQFKKIIKNNPNITKDEWDEFAMENMLYSYITLEAHTDTYSFEELKKYCKILLICEVHTNML